jgi:hypothetical protein
MVVPTLTVNPSGGTEIAVSAQIPFKLWGDGGEFKPDPDDLVVAVEPAPGLAVEADLSGLAPDATVILWARANF